MSHKSRRLFLSETNALGQAFIPLARVLYVFDYQAFNMLPYKPQQGK